MRLTITIIALLAVAIVLGAAHSDLLFAASTNTDQEQAEVGESEEKTNVREVPTPKLVEGKRERRLTRVNAWIASLEGDKKRIYDRYGHPSGRYREESMGAVVEKWVYSDIKKTFTFRGNKLIR